MSMRALPSHLSSPRHKEQLATYLLLAAPALPALPHFVRFFGVLGIYSDNAHY